MTNTAPSMSQRSTTLFCSPTGPPAGGGYDELLDAARRRAPALARPDAEGLGALSEAERDGRARRAWTGACARPASPTTSLPIRTKPVAALAARSGAGRHSRSAEWRWLETALIQRARLFDALLTDLYGEQRLMREGAVPPELMFSDSAFLRPCQGILPNAGGLQFYAADLARGADGHWRDHRQSHRDAGRRRLRARQPRRAHACRRRPVQALQRGAARGLLPEPAERADRPQRPRQRPHRAADAGPAPRGLFLARLSRALSRLSAGRRLGSAHQGQSGLSEDARRAEGDRPDRALRRWSLESIRWNSTRPASTVRPDLLRVSRKTPQLVVNAVGSALAQNRGLGRYLPKLAEAPARRRTGTARRAALVARRCRRRARMCSTTSTTSSSARRRKAPAGRGRRRSARTPRALSAAERELLKREIELHGARLVAEEKIGFSTAPGLRPQGPDAAAVRRPLVRRAHR